MMLVELHAVCEQGPNRSSDLVGLRDDHDVSWTAFAELLHPGTLLLRTAHCAARRVYKERAQVCVASLTDSEQLDSSARSTLSRNQA